MDNETQATTTSIALIRTCFKSEHYHTFFKGQKTDDAALRFVGQLVHHTTDHQLIRRIVKSGLPEGYAGDTLERLDGMIDRAIEKGWDTPSKGKKTLAAELVDMVLDLDIDLFHDGYGRTFITFRDEGKGPITYALTSTAAKQQISGRYYKTKGKPISSNSFKEALDTLIAVAMFDGQEKSVHLRVARAENAVLVNLATTRGEAAFIMPDSYTVVCEHDTAFVSSPNMAAMPLPQEDTGDAFRELQDLLGLSEDNFARLLAFMINCFKPEGPYLVLIVEGEQGSGKSEFNRTIKMIVDPRHAAKLRQPKSEEDLMLIAKDTHLPIFDNISGMSVDMSDALCSLLTGGGFATRKFYTNDELHISYETRPVIINGITGIATRPDLLERSLSLRLPTMPAGQRKTEAELRSTLQDILPRLLDRIFKAVACAIKRLDEVEAPKTVRMADVARWLVAAEPATGLAEGSLVRALEGSQQDVIAESMHNNSLAIAIMRRLEVGPFEGTIGKLYEDLEESRSRYDKSFPPTSAHLSRALERLRLALEKIDISVEFGQKTRKGRHIKIWWLSDGTFSDSKEAHVQRSGEFIPS